MFQVNIDVSGSLKALANVQRIIEQGGVVTTHELAIAGKGYASTIAPKYSGETIEHIKVFEGKTLGGSYAQIIAKNVLKDGHRRAISNFDLTLWMHATGGMRRGQRGRFTGKHIKSGNPRFMSSTNKYLNGIARGVAERNILTRIRLR